MMKRSLSDSSLNKYAKGIECVHVLYQMTMWFNQATTSVIRLTSSFLCCLTGERIVGVGEVHRLWVRHTGLALVPFVPLPLPVPHKQAEHGHNDEKQKDNSHDSACRLPLRAPRWANLGVRVQLLHHQSCYRENSDVQTWVFVPLRRCTLTTVITSHLDHSECLYTRDCSSTFPSRSHRWHCWGTRTAAGSHNRMYQQDTLHAERATLWYLSESKDFKNGRPSV